MRVKFLVNVVFNRNFPFSLIDPLRSPLQFSLSIKLSRRVWSIIMFLKVALFNSCWQLRNLHFNFEFQKCQILTVFWKLFSLITFFIGKILKRADSEKKLHIVCYLLTGGASHNSQGEESYERNEWILGGSGHMKNFQGRIGVKIFVWRISTWSHRFKGRTTRIQQY